MYVYREKNQFSNTIITINKGIYTKYKISFDLEILQDYLKKIFNRISKLLKGKQLKI